MTKPELAVDPKDFEPVATYEPQCCCTTEGEDDGDYTCPVHHDCRDGTCTHAEDYDSNEVVPEYADKWEY